MGILSKVVGSGVGSVVKEVGGIIDNLSTSTEEKLKLKTDLENVFNKRLEIQQNDEINMRSEISKRWSSDSTSDISLAKLIRPMILMLWTVILIGIMIATIFLEMQEQQLGTLTLWMPLIQTIIVTIYAAYFGGRSLEKIIHTNQKSKEVGSALDYIKTVDTTKILKNQSSMTQDSQPSVTAIDVYKTSNNNKRNEEVYSDVIDEFLGN